MEKKLAMAANVAIIVVAILVGITFIRNWRHSESANAQRINPQVLVGKRFPIAQSWSGRRTVVLALSVGCHYCSASAGFYQRLASYAAEHQANIVALVPQSKEEGARYVQELKLNIPVVGQVDFRQIDVSGTPTLFLVDGSGKVQDVWQGQLEDSRENKVFASLG
jgi:peroxiredoxin